MKYVYLLLCGDGKTYVGYTKDLKNRILRHSRGEVLSTRNRRPIKLLAYFAFENKYTAVLFEKYLKSGSGRAFLKKHFLK